MFFVRDSATLLFINLCARFCFVASPSFGHSIFFHSLFVCFFFVFKYYFIILFFLSFCLCVFLTSVAYLLTYYHSHAIYLTIIIIYNILISFVCAYMCAHVRTYGKDSVEIRHKKRSAVFDTPFISLNMF